MPVVAIPISAAAVVGGAIEPAAALPNDHRAESQTSPLQVAEVMLIVEVPGA